MIEKAPEISELLSTKTVEIFKSDEGDALKLQLDNPQLAVDMAVNPDLISDLFVVNDNGQKKIDYKKWNKFVAFISNPDRYDAELFKHGKGIGMKSIADEVSNNDIPDVGGRDGNAGGSVAEQMLKAAIASKGK